MISLPYFIGLTFLSNTSSTRGIESFQRRFDHKARESAPVFLPLTPIFWLDPKEAGPFIDELEDQLYSYLMGLDEGLHVSFTQMDVISGKEKVLYLRPTLPAEISHLIEGLLELFHTQLKRVAKVPKETKRGFLTLGRFYDPIDLEQAITIANSEFSFPFNLEIKDVVLFRKSKEDWVLQDVLYCFHDHSSEFLQEACEIL